MMLLGVISLLVAAVLSLVVAGILTRPRSMYHL